MTRAVLLFSSPVVCQLRQVGALSEGHPALRLRRPRDAPPRSQAKRPQPKN